MEERIIDMPALASKLRERVDVFLQQVHEEFRDEFTYFITRIEPSMSLIDNLAAQRLLVRSVTFDLVKRVIQEQLPEELIMDQPEKSEENNVRSSV